MLKTILSTIFLLILLNINCTENTLKSNSSDKEIESKSFQIPGCIGSGLNKTTEEDSCFAYNFTDTLNMEFCVIGNCCPDSLRFVSDINIKSDTIYVSVTDTAENLCDCMCKYKIRLEINGLSEEKYLFYCDFPIYYDTLEYREYVFR